MREAAARFFSALIELDGTGSEIIYAETIPEKGLGKGYYGAPTESGKKNGWVNH